MSSVALLENDSNSNLRGAADAIPLLAPPCPDYHGPRCKALLADELTPCNAPSTSGLFCASHGKQCGESHKEYKEASQIAADLGTRAPMKERQICALLNVVEVDQAIAATRAWHDAVADEMRGRWAHTTRFFEAKLDDGHERRLQGLANKLTEAKKQVERLEGQRQSLLKSSIPADAVPDPVLGYIPVPVSSTTVLAPYAIRPTSAPPAIPTHKFRRELELPAAPVRVNHVGPPLPTHIPHRAPLLPSSSTQSNTRPPTPTTRGARYGYSVIMRLYAWLRAFQARAIPSRTALPNTYPTYSLPQESLDSDGGDSFLQKLLKGVMPLVRWLAYCLVWWRRR